MDNEQLVDLLAHVADDIINARCDLCDVHNATEHQDALDNLLQAVDRINSIVDQIEAESLQLGG